MTKQALILWVLHVNMAFLLILLIMQHASQVASLASPCGGLKQEHHLFRADNRVLLNSVYKKTIVPSQVICGRDCSMDSNCKSINYYRCTSLCELNNATRSGNSQDFVEDQGTAYFDTDEDTPRLSLAHTSSFGHKSCKRLFDAGFCSSGGYTIHPDGFNDDGLQVYCDMTTDGGGWIVFQRRQDGSVDFYLDWAEYKSGFGDVSGEFWLGNDNLVNLTSDITWELRIDLGDFDDNTAWAKYQDFKISGTKYTLSFGAYDVNSTAGDALKRHNGMRFTTKDSDNDMWPANCAKSFHGAWWFKDCTNSHLNGKYYSNPVTEYNEGITWSKWLGKQVSLKQCSMKIREL